MERARNESQWVHTSHLLAWMENCTAFFRKGQPTKPEDRNPFAKPNKRGSDIIQLSPKDSIAALGAMLMRSAPTAPKRIAPNARIGQ